MNQKHKFVIGICSVTVLVLLACSTTQVMPTLIPTQQPVSTANPDMFSTMVADAAGAFLTQTAQAAPPSPASEMLQPTETPIPTATETPVTSLSGTSLTKMEDGSTQFIDNLAGVRLTIPPGWVTVRLNEPEYFEVWSLTVDDPILQQGLEGIQNLDPARFRLHAFNTQPDYVYQGAGSRINVVYIRDDPRTLEQVAEDEKQPQAFTDYSLVSSEFQVRPDNLDLFSIEEQWRGFSTTNASLMLYYTGVFFKVPSGTVGVDLLLPADIKHEVEPVFYQMIEQMTVFTP